MLSVGIITFNEEKRLARTLEAIRDLADEIVIVDSYSSDRTVEIAKSYSAKVEQMKWKGYGAQKNSVIELCNNEWILLIDADEVLTKECKEEIREILKTPQKSVYKIPRESICFGKIIRFGGWGSNTVVRLFRKGSGKYSLDDVHEQFLTNEKIGRLKYKIEHYTYEDYSDYLTKFNRYTSEGALVSLKKGKTSGIFNIIINPIFKFIRMYIFRLGFLDGIDGLALAVLSALYTSIKYLKLRELRKTRELKVRKSDKIFSRKNKKVR